MASPGGGGGSGISYDTFKEWTRTCGVRKVQKEYERMAEEAQEKGKTATEEMQARGYKDYASFSKACPEFPLFCWPTEFAELGSGFVLYFHFLAMLGLLFLLLFLLQTPAMYSYYSSPEWLAGWQWNRWQNAYAVGDSCTCLGDNKGITGPKNAAGQLIFSTSDYGTSCAAWDMRPGVCDSNGNSCAYQQPGKWVCQRWCFVRSHCSPAPDELGTSLSDRRYLGLVKSYSACQQEATEVAQCTNVTGANVMFNEMGVEVESGSSNYIGTLWMTPGNFGPDQATNMIIPLMYVVCVGVICLLIFLEFQKMVLINRQVDSDTTSPNDFAALVRGLPATATDGKAIAQFFKENAVFGKDDTDIVKVVIGWDAQEYIDRVRELKSLRAQKAKLPDDDPQHEEINKRVKEINHDLASSATEKAARLRSSGVVVVVFRYQSDLRACLARWTSFWARWFYCDAVDACCLPAGNKFWGSSELPRFPIGNPPRPVHKIQVERAPNPGDINWMELGVPREKRLKMFAKTNGAMALLVCISFGICYGFKMLQDALSSGGQGFASDLLTVLPALGVGIMNALLTWCARKLGDYEYHDTITVQEFSQALKMSIGMIVNTAGVMYFISATPYEWYRHGGLTTNAFTMLLLNATIPPLIPYLDIGYRMKGRVRRQLTQEKIDHMNAVGSKKPTTAEEQDALKKVRTDIQKFQKAYAPTPMNETRRYALALKTAVCCLFYMPMMPWLALVGAVGIGLQYWMDKYMLLRWYHRPSKPASASMAMFSLKFLKYTAPLGVSFTTWLFLTPSFENKRELLFYVLICAAISVIFSFFTPLSIWTKFFFVMCVGSEPSSSAEQDYYKAQYMWSTEMKYHKDHFMLKPLPESVNPEYLKPGEEAASEVEAVKASYGAATAQAAADASSGEEIVRMKGGKVVGTAIAGGGGKAPAPAPAVYGAPAAASPEEVVPEVAEPEEAEAPPPAPVPPPPMPEPASSSRPAAAAAAPAPSGGSPKWEFEAGHGWKRFDDDCHDFIEKQYQKWKAGKGKEQIEVRTGGDKKLSLNFRKMTQKMVGSHSIRNVRRTGDKE